jgi:hypothetical protein
VTEGQRATSENKATAVIAGTPEYSAAMFCNPMLYKRFGIIMRALQQRPGGSLPQVFRQRAALKGAYRFLNHPDTTVPHLLPALVRPAVRSLSRSRLVLVVHDTTSFNFTRLTKANGLGYLNDAVAAQGIHLHSSLLLDQDGTLAGLAHLHFWVRCHFRQGTDEQIRQLPIEAKESFKWLRGIDAATAAFGCLAEKGQTRLPQLVHVMDREGDIHEVFALVRQLGHDAVIRCCQNRRVEAEQPDQIDRAQQRVAKQPSLGRIDLCVPLQEGGFRQAQVEVRSLRVRLLPHQTRRNNRHPIDLWLMGTREVSLPPAGEKPAQWWLWTTRPGQTIEQVKSVLTIYRTRWRVEDYHRVLKTGCKVEKMRLLDGEALTKVIAMQAWVATQVLRLRDAAKNKPEEDCEKYFTAQEWKMLWAQHYERPWRSGDGKPTLAEVAMWLGGLGGHLGRNGDGLPGAELLSRGLYALSLLVEGRQITLTELGLSSEVPTPNQNQK